MTSHPAMFANWVRGRSDKLRHDGRPQWQPSAEHDRSARVIVVAHVAGQEDLSGLMRRLPNVPVPFALFITSPVVTELEIGAVDDFPMLDEVRVLPVDAANGPLLALLEIVNAGLLRSADIVLHLREASPQVLDGVIGSPELVATILGVFAEDPSLGIVSVDGMIQEDEAWGDALPMTQELLRRLELEVDPDALRFPVGSGIWARSFLIAGLRALDISVADFGDDAEQRELVECSVERIIGLLATESGFVQSETSTLCEPAEKRSWERYAPDAELLPEARVFPFYLPQFHSFPENDSWWGAGFSEWNNVTAAKPMFTGHRQPNLPGELGFYDLNDPRVRVRQFELAGQAGIEGMMYYYYWFSGHRLMEMPIEQLLGSADQHHFCIMWANENWTRRWDGGSQHVLIAQDHDEVSPRHFIDDVMHLITDPRYVRVDGKPLIAVYRITQLPDYETVIEHWRERARENGLAGLHVLSVDVGSGMQGFAADSDQHALDGIMEFPPHNKQWVLADTSGREFDPMFAGNVMRYDALVDEAEGALLSGIETNRYPGVLVNFDNTARRQLEPDLWVGANPFTFRRWLRNAVIGVQNRAWDERIVFINAWNEWAEGAVLEPSQRFGETYLQAVRSAVICP